MSHQENHIEAAPSNDAASEAQTTIANAANYSGGNATLDAEVTMAKELDDTAVEEPVATNTPDVSPPKKPVIETTGAFPPNLNQLTDQGNLSIAKDSPQ